jgi:hypothetical protein
LRPSGRGPQLPLQTWPLAYWPDGSLKWTAHAATAHTDDKQHFVVVADDMAADAKLGPAVSLRESEAEVDVDTGVIRCRIPKSGNTFIASLERSGQTIARDAKLVCIRQDSVDQDSVDAATGGAVRRESFTGVTDKVTVEQSGPVRAVVRVEGKHITDGAFGARSWLPFTLRLYFYAGSDAVRMMHTFIFDGDERKDFLAGLGVRFSVLMRDRPQDRHVRLTADGGGVWAEAVRTLTGLRRDVGKSARQAQIDGKPTPKDEELPRGMRAKLELVPAWGDFTLSQLCADGFQIRKRTKAGHGWIPAGAGNRAAGAGYVGGASGGVAFGLRDFWQRHPTQLDVRGAAGDAAEVTLWMYSPDAPPMDMRFYHDGMGLETHAQQLDALDITYEDYEPGFATPYGIARTSELTLWALAETPSRQAMVDITRAVQRPPVLVCAPERYHAAGVFGAWGLPDRSSPAKRRIEDQLDFLLGYYVKQVEQRRWYGFWDYGDVMHGYDPDRNVWRYDVGGYAWDNSELSTDLWLWYSFLRGGRADVFRMAEAMTRHTGEVDVYHAGGFAGLGSRHNVMHWGCSAKQLRISTATYRRMFYYLTADERVGDLMRELVGAERNFLTLDPLRKVRREPFTPKPHALGVSFGLDWGSLIATWLTEWERTGDTRWKDRLLAGMRSIGAMPHGFFTAGATFDPETFAFTDDGSGRVDVSHLSTLFGLPEILAELIPLFGDEAAGFERAWLQYCDLYNASGEAKQQALGRRVPRTGQVGAHSKLTAYAASRRRDSALAERAWREFSSGWPTDWYAGRVQRVEPPDVLTSVEEAPWVTTNDASQWSLAAIANLALISDALPAPS